MKRFILGPLLTMLLAVLISAQGLAQGEMSESNSSASSVQAPLDDKDMASIEAADGPEAITEAEVDQLIQTITDDSGGTEGTEAADGPETAEVEETGQSTQAPEDDSSSAAEVNQESGTIKEAEEIDQLIQVLVEDDGSTNEEVEADQDAGAAGKEEATNQTIVISGESIGEDISKISTEAGQDLEAINQTQSMDQLIQTLVDTDGNNSSEITQDLKSINETETGQPIQMPIDGATGVEAAQQIGIQEKTKSMGQLIQTIVNDKSRTDTITAQGSETIEKTESIVRLIQTLEDEGDTASGDEAISGQDLEIVDEEGSMELLIQALEGSYVQ